MYIYVVCSIYIKKNRLLHLNVTQYVCVFMCIFHVISSVFFFFKISIYIYICCSVSFWKHIFFSESGQYVGSGSVSGLQRDKERVCMCGRILLALAFSGIQDYSCLDELYAAAVQDCWLVSVLDASIFVSFMLRTHFRVTLQSYYQKSPLKWYTSCNNILKF